MNISIWKLIWMLIRASTWYLYGMGHGDKADCSFTFQYSGKWWTVTVKEDGKCETD